MASDGSKPKRGDELLLSNLSTEGEPLDPARIGLSGLRTELAQFKRLGIVPAEFKPGTLVADASMPVEPQRQISKSHWELEAALKTLAVSANAAEGLKNAESQFRLAIKEADAYYAMHKAAFVQEHQLLSSELKAAQQESAVSFADFEAALGKIPDNQALKMFHFVQAFISMAANDPDSKPTGAILDRHGLLKVSQSLVRANTNSYRINQQIAVLKIKTGSAESDRIRSREAYIEALKHAGQIALAIKYMNEMPDIWADRIFKDVASEPAQRQNAATSAAMPSATAKTIDRRRPKNN